MTTSHRLDPVRDEEFADSTLSPEVATLALNSLGFQFDPYSEEGRKAAMEKADEILHEDAPRTEAFLSLLQVFQNAARPVETKSRGRFTPSRSRGPTVDDFMFEDAATSSEGDTPLLLDTLRPLTPDAFTSASAEEERVFRTFSYKSSGDYAHLLTVLYPDLTRDHQEPDVTAVRRDLANAAALLHSKTTWLSHVFSTPEVPRTYYWHVRPNAGVLELTLGEKNCVIVYAIDGHAVHLTMGDDRLEAPVGQPARLSTEMVAFFHGHSDMAREALKAMHHATEGPGFPSNAKTSDILHSYER